MLKCITCFWKGDWKLSLFSWLILALLLIYFFPVILLSQPAGFDLGEGILRGMCGRKLELKVVIGKMERRYACSREKLFCFVFLRKERSMFRVDFGDLCCLRCHLTLSPFSETVSKVCMTYEALVGLGRKEDCSPCSGTGFVYKAR